MEAHKVAHGAPRGACADGGQSVSGQDEAMLLMVENTGPDSNATVLRHLDELQSGGTASYIIPFRFGCSYTLFQGEPAK